MAVLRIVGAAREGDGVPRIIMQAVGRSVDGSNGRLIVANREPCRVAGGCTINVACPPTENSAVITSLHSIERIGSRSGSGNIHAVALPLVIELLRSGRSHGECRRASNGRRLVLGVQGDAGSAGKPHPINRTATAIQMVKRTIGAYFQVHGAG